MNLDELSEKQQASFDRSLQRASARAATQHGYDDEKLHLFIRVAESRIYNGKPVYKALLKEVIFMRLTDLHKGDLRIPKGTPWSGDYRKYEGWCYAGQEYLANRVGVTPTYPSKVLKKIVKDGYLKTRRWRDKRGAWHRQYFPDEAFIDAKIAELNAEDTHLHDVQEDTCTNCNSPLALIATDHLHVVQNPLAISARKEVSEWGSLSGVSEEVSISTHPPASPSGELKSNPNSKTQNVKAGSRQSEEKSRKQTEEYFESATGGVA